MPDNTVRIQDTCFKPGQSGNPAGRPKGSRNKVSEKLLEALASDFDAHGQHVILRAERPADYLKIVASSFPSRWRLTTFGPAEKPKTYRMMSWPP